MKKTVTITLSEQAYEHVMLHYLLGYLVHDEVDSGDQNRQLLAAEVNTKLCEAGYLAKLKNYVQLAPHVYAFPGSTEKTMLDIYQKFIDYIESGEREAEMEAIKKQIDDMRRNGLL